MTRNQLYAYSAAMLDCYNASISILESFEGDESLLTPEWKEAFGLINKLRSVNEKIYAKEMPKLEEG